MKWPNALPRFSNGMANSGCGRRVFLSHCRLTGCSAQGAMHRRPSPWSKIPRERRNWSSWPCRGILAVVWEGRLWQIPKQPPWHPTTGNPPTRASDRVTGTPLASRVAVLDATARRFLRRRAGSNFDICSRAYTASAVTPVATNTPLPLLPVRTICK